MTLTSRVAKLEQRRYGRSVAHLSAEQRRELEREKYLEGLSDEELAASIQAARAALVTHLRAEREQLDRRHAEGNLTAEEFDAWLQEQREYIDVIRNCDPDTAAELERAAA